MVAARVEKSRAEVEDLFSKYRLSEALMAVYKLFWDEFSAWYLEMIKPAYGSPIDRQTYELTLSYFDSLLRLLHPFMPFITEELWQNICERKQGETIMLAQLEGFGEVDEALLSEAEHLKQIITAVRNIRQQRNIPQKEQMELQVVAAGRSQGSLSSAARDLVVKLSNLGNISEVTQKSANSASFIIGTTEYAVPLDAFINVEEEIRKLEADLKYQEGFLAGVMKKLSNERFVQNAKPEVVAMERKKQADAESRIAALKESIAALTLPQ